MQYSSSITSIDLYYRCDMFYLALVNSIIKKSQASLRMWSLELGVAMFRHTMLPTLTEVSHHRSHQSCLQQAYLRWKCSYFTILILWFESNSLSPMILAPMPFFLHLNHGRQVPDRQAHWPIIPQVFCMICWTVQNYAAVPTGPSKLSNTAEAVSQDIYNYF